MQKHVCMQLLWGGAFMCKLPEELCRYIRAMPKI